MELNMIYSESSPSIGSQYECVIVRAYERHRYNEISLLEIEHRDFNRNSISHKWEPVDYEGAQLQRYAILRFDAKVREVADADKMRTTETVEGVLKCKL